VRQSTSDKALPFPRLRSWSDQGKRVSMRRVQPDDTMTLNAHSIEYQITTAALDQVDVSAVAGAGLQPVFQTVTRKTVLPWILSPRSDAG
jgi:hypothetical protein